MECGKVGDELLFVAGLFCFNCIFCFLNNSLFALFEVVDLDLCDNGKKFIGNTFWNFLMSGGFGG